MMHDPLRGLFDTLHSGGPLPSWKPGDLLAIYGAGGFGRDLHRAFTDRAMPVWAFIDRAATPGQTLQGIPVLHPDALTARQWAPLIVIIGIHNPVTPVRDLQDDLQARGCGQVLTPVQIVNHFGPSFGTRYWLGSTSHYVESERDIRAAREVLEPGSHALFDAVLEHRIRGDYRSLPNPTHALDDYLPVDVAPFNRPMRVIDGGAYDGDTLRGLLKHGFPLESVAAFEPDAENFSKLATWVRNQAGLTAALWPCGLHAKATQLRFSSGQGEASAITDDGNVVIQCVSVDEALPGFAPTLLKLDVEGSEPEALLGARNTITSQKPFIVAGLYHHPTHLWEVPLLLKRIEPGYTLHLRSHAHNGFELWLHAVPQDGLA